MGNIFIYECFVFYLDMAWKDGSFDIFKKTLLIAFLYHKRSLRLSISILAKNAFFKCFLELKNTLVFTT